MTQTPEFDTFSQMLDSEDDLQGFDLTEDQKLLVDLREVLREDTERVSLPEDFAERTAEIVSSRYSRLSISERLLDQSRVHLTDSLFRPSGLAKGLGLVALGAGLAAASFKALAAYGGILLAFSLLWLLKEMRSGGLELAHSGPTGGSGHRVATFLFYCLPTLAVAGTAFVAAAVVGLLGIFSISFRDNAAGMLFGFEILVALGTATLLAKACLPYWRAYRARAATHPGRLTYFQALHAAWLGGLIFLFAGNVNAKSEYHRMEIDHFVFGSLVAIVVLLVVSVAVAHRYSVPALDPPDFQSARRTFFGSVVFGFLPILIALTAFYQMHLTREIKDPSYEYRLRDVNAWYASQKTIPSDQNGYVALRPFLVMTEQDKPKNSVVASGFRALAEFHENGSSSYRNLDQTEQAEFQKKKAEFLAQLPRIESAIAKPHFSVVAVEGFSFQSLVPNFITIRSVNQGLSLLTQEALEKGDTQAALDYAVLGIRWATADGSDNLIREMVKIAQLDITLTDLQQPITSRRFDRAQLEELSSALREALPTTDEFVQVMNKEMAMVDGAFKEFLTDGNVTWEELDNIGVPPILSLFPASYWESERKAYWNHQLAMASGWGSLSNPQFGLDLMVNPMNVGAESLTPNSGRAMVRFCYLHSRMSAVIVMCELEIYKMDNGDYPESLDLLPVPARTPVSGRDGDVTLDMMNTRPRTQKAQFQYQRKGDGYTLSSSSPWYEKIELESPQIYGPESGK